MFFVAQAQLLNRLLPHCQYNTPRALAVADASMLLQPLQNLITVLELCC